MANVVRHARAESVFVEIERGERGVRLSVEDDGQGFDPAAFARPDESGKGLGLAGMRERVELMGGVLRIDSAPGRGTVVSVEIPLPPSISGEES